jgi:hypothetical protein
LPQRVQASIVSSIRAFTASMNPPPPSANVRLLVAMFLKITETTFSVTPAKAGGHVCPGYRPSLV